eukprot:1184596-Prorocentrum_minimum.AAC.2
MRVRRHTAILLDFTGPSVPITTSMHSTPQGVRRHTIIGTLPSHLADPVGSKEDARADQQPKVRHHTTITPGRSGWQ